ncbi:MAG: hypothetical protein IJG60_08195 [Thermoguttaceae bacterium]|nr:hypothetical protein [Thermoguttaceae bacterium]
MKSSKLTRLLADPTKLEAVITGWLAVLLGAALEIGGIYLICAGFVSSSRTADTVLDAGDAARYSAETFFAFFFGAGLTLFGILMLFYAWYAFRYAKRCS